LKTELIVIGKARAKFVKLGIDYYQTRLSSLNPVRIVTVKPEPITRSKRSEDIKLAESQRILDRIDSQTLVIALDPEGKELTSSQLAGKIGEWEQTGRNKMVFIIGGPLGLHAEVIKRADSVLALSRLTFSHELCLLAGLEQLYRAYSIKAGLPYAK
jgi:23S rRNA (pseudouridine1915-N3)-methyltransferase